MKPKKTIHKLMDKHSGEKRKWLSSTMYKEKEKVMVESRYAPKKDDFLDEGDEVLYPETKHSFTMCQEHPELCKKWGCKCTCHTPDTKNELREKIKKITRYKSGERLIGDEKITAIFSLFASTFREMLLDNMEIIFKEYKRALKEKNADEASGYAHSYAIKKMLLERLKTYEH